ncbi:hypothetical protein LshimejAT787_1402090 [Lyophyllum shimeji]|uniref:F-box domain-containing protein n=1 Tax=Lyophyllum shimeji TaxID=47721 RepID=A0A9P3PYS0_LYOSH|nr:hypothetical protein LshimejAT787_1402090 [Lyophyllum shimeji]
MAVQLADNFETPENRENEQEPPQKRIKITADNGRKVIQDMKNARLDKRSAPLRRTSSRGRLAPLISLPMDVLFEIFGHLLPLDVLHVARATKEFRRVLLHRSAITIWKAALANVPELPECPPEMSLPAWANLVFDLHCHNCGNSHAKNVVDFILRVRLCGPCSKLCLLSSKYFDEEETKDKLILKCVPFSKWNKGAVTSCLISDRDEFLKKLGNPNCNRQEFIDSRRAEVKSRIEHGKRCHSWLDEQTEAREKELDDIKLKRKNAIIDKLADLGYAEEIDYMSDLEDRVMCGVAESGVQLLSKHPSVRIAMPLTEQGWSNIKSKMVKYMEAVKAQMLQEDRLKLLETRKEKALDAWHTYCQKNVAVVLSRPIPSPVDILALQKVQDMVNLPSQEEVTCAMFLEVLNDEVPDLLETFRRTQESKLAEKHPCAYPKYWSPGCANLRKVHLAVCVFMCTADIVHLRARHDEDLVRCLGEDGRPPLFYPEFLFHPCNSICEKRWLGEDEAVKILDKNERLSVSHQFRGCRRQRRSSEKLVPHEKASRVVEKILEACRLDPRTTTVKNMDELDPRLICLKCTFGAKADGERRCSVWSWRNAVNHCLRVHWGAAISWQKISDEDAVAARALEKLEPARREVPAPEPMWRCTVCLDTPGDPGRMTRQRLVKHYQRLSTYDPRHRNPKDSLQHGRDFYRALECPPPQPLTVKMVPKAVP